MWRGTATRPISSAATSRMNAPISPRSRILEALDAELDRLNLAHPLPRPAAPRTSGALKAALELGGTVPSALHKRRVARPRAVLVVSLSSRCSVNTFSASVGTAKPAAAKAAAYDKPGPGSRARRTPATNTALGESPPSFLLYSYKHTHPTPVIIYLRDKLQTNQVVAKLKG